MTTPSQIDVSTLREGETKALLERAELAENKLQGAHDVIARIWAILGNPTYEELAGRSIYDLVQKLVDDKAQEQRSKEPVAVRYDFDGFGWQYLDSGSGNDWLFRHKDADRLYSRDIGAQRFVAQIVTCAENIAWQAGVGSLETAGQIVSFLADRPEMMPAFMDGSLSAMDTDLLDHHAGRLSWHGMDGKVYAPDPAKAGRFREPKP